MFSKCEKGHAYHHSCKTRFVYAKRLEFIVWRLMNKTPEQLNFEIILLSYCNIKFAEWCHTLYFSLPSSRHVAPYSSTYFSWTRISISASAIPQYFIILLLLLFLRIVQNVCFHVSEYLICANILSFKRIEQTDLNFNLKRKSVHSVLWISEYDFLFKSFKFQISNLYYFNIAIIMSTKWFNIQLVFGRSTSRRSTSGFNMFGIHLTLMWTHFNEWKREFHWNTDRHYEHLLLNWTPQIDPKTKL